jgi:serine/threonine-protein kinase
VSSQTPTFEKRVEDRIARLLGPVAPHLVRKISVEAATPRDLCEQVAAFIPSGEDRRAFLAWCSAELNASGPVRERPRTLSRASRAAVAWDPAVLERARRDLAVHLGPLAGIIVRRVCSRARDRQELYELMAQEIPGDAARETFRRLAPADVSPPDPGGA